MLRRIFTIILLIFVFFVTGCGGSDSDGDKAVCYQKGFAAFYTLEENGTLTFFDEHYERSKLTAAHANLPYGTKVKVTNLNNGRSVTVVINDRISESNNIIKLSEKAALELATSTESNHEFSIDIVKWG